MNLNTLVVVADAARARFFHLVATEGPRAPVVLREAQCLVHADGRLKDAERYTGSAPTATRSTGARTGNGAGPRHTVDDHRNAHDAEDRRRFAKTIAQSVARSVQSSGAPVVVVASHSLYAFLTNELDRELPKDARVRPQLAELSDLTPSELLNELSSRGALRA
jgi:hypothetical protein